ncbi:E3 ubiquitin-protein ligase listerin-like protein, partial [Leptotrombidium deliense]
SISKNSIFGVTLKNILKELSIPKFPECCPLVTQNYTWESLVTMQLVTSQLEKSLLSSNSLLSIDDGLSSLALINSITSLDINLNFDEHINPLLEYMLGFKETKSAIYSYKKDNAYLQFAATIIGVYENILRFWKNEITNEQKDLIFCSVTSWIINMSEDKENLQNSTPFLVFAYRALNLVRNISKIIDDQPDYSGEWTGFHANKIYGTLIPYFCTFDKAMCSPQIYHFLCALSDAVLATSSSQNMSFSNVLKEKSCPQYIWGNLKTVPFYFSDEESVLLSNLCPLMNNRRRPLYFTSHRLIMKILHNIASSLKIETLDDDECYLTPPTHILTILRETDEVVETMLNEFRVGDCCCIVDTSTDSYHYTLCYLLSWMQVLRYSTLLNPENRSLLSGFLTESGLFFKFMNNLFRLMPVSDGNDEIVRTMFLNSLKLDVHCPPSACEVQHVACQLFLTSLKTMPASVRLWVGSQDKRIVDVVNNFTTMNVSQYMSSEEFLAIQNRDLSSFKNMTIKTRPAAREIFAVYSVEDMSIELTITFPTNHPISPVAIDFGKRVGVSSSQWRTWLLQLTTFLTHQNGSIVDGLSLWKKNIDKRFEGVEECMICFYILHGSTCQLPKLTCKHCKKKYHSACLFKWFKTSNNATCPLCRNLFDTKV